MQRPYLMLYHCNDTVNCKKFVENDKCLIYKREGGIWLGSGMYFWDNLSNAEFWKREKIKKDSEKEYCIVQAGVFLDKLLDLTDLDVAKKMTELWERYVQVNNLKKEEKLGTKLNILFKTFNLEKEYNVVKVYGKYYYTPDNGLWSYDMRSYSPEPVSNIKCIYSVKNVDAIDDRAMIK